MADDQHTRARTKIAVISTSPTPAANRIAVIEDSLRAFAFAWPGLIPVLGLPFAIAALSVGLRARNRERDGHNPAARYRTAALCLGSIGTAASFLVLVLFFLATIAA